MGGRGVDEKLLPEIYMTYTVDQIRDKRSLYRAKHDFDFGHKNEVIVMQGMYAWCYSRGIECDYEPVDKNEAFADGKVHITPDYFATINGEKRTYEIKCSTTNGFTVKDNREYIYVKPHSIWTMKNNPNTYPNGKLLVSTRRRFSVLDVHKVIEYPIEKIEEWGEKEAFVIPSEDLIWHSWLVPLDVH